MSEPIRPDPRNGNGVRGLGPVADELRRESERLRQLAEELKARDEDQAEMRANYPYLKQAVYASLREQFERDLAPVPETDLEAFAEKEGAQPLEAFIDELEKTAEGP